MRYSKSESTNILALFGNGDAVTIDIYRLSDNAKIVDGATCLEVESTGVFSYDFSQTVTQKEEYLWIMTNGEYSKYGKIVLGGYMDTISDNVNQHRNSVEPKIDTTISSRASQESVNNIPTNPLLDNDSRLDNLDATISSRSSHTPTDVWSYTTRSITKPVYIAESDKDSIVDKVWDESILEHTSPNTFGSKNQKGVPSENIDNYKADISDLAKEVTVQAIKSQTDKLKFNTDNDVKATLDGEVVNLSSETEAQIDNIESNVTNVDQYKADVSDLALEATAQAIKSQTDKLQFDVNNNVKSSAQNPQLSYLDAAVSTRASQSSVDAINNKLSTLVSDIWNYSSRTLTSFGNLVSNVWNYVTRTLTESVIISDSDKDDIVDRVWDEAISEHTTSGTFGQKNQNKVPSENIDDYKADTSSLAKEATVQSIKNQTDKFKFNADNDVIATLDNETVRLTSETETQIDEIESAVNQIKTKTNNLPSDPASNTDINDAKNSIVSEIRLNRDLINEILDVEEGNWEIKDNQMIFYRRDGTELIRFNLYDKLGNLTELNAYKRQRV